MSASTDRFPDGAAFPEGYFPVGQPVDEGDVVLYALQPQNDSVEHCFIVRAYRGEELLGEKKIPMSHDSRFGIDAEDGAALEAGTDEWLAEIRGALGLIHSRAVAQSTSRPRPP